jgi:hypothetical protein
MAKGASKETLRKARAAFSKKSAYKRLAKDLEDEGHSLIRAAALIRKKL